MPIKLMRGADFWVGVLLCFLLTLIRYLLDLFSFKRINGGSFRKILFLKPSEMGGIILSHPLMRLVGNMYPQADLFFLTFRSNRPLFDVMDIIPTRNVMTIRDDSLISFFVDTFRTIGRLRREKIDVVFDLEFFARYTAILSFLIGAPRRIGFVGNATTGPYRGRLLTDEVPLDPKRHVAETYLAMANALGISDEVPIEEDLSFPRFAPAQEQKDALRLFLKKAGVPDNAKLFLMNPGEGRLPLREWPLERFADLSRKVLEAANAHIVLVGMDADAPKMRALLREVAAEERCHDLCGQTTLEQLLALCAMSEAMVTNDSGLAHLASLTGIRQCVLFGPESPAVFAPVSDMVHVFYAALPCSPCLSAFNHRTSDCRDNRCLAQITVEEVYESLMGMELCREEDGSL